MNNRIRVLNFDDSVTKQIKLLEKYDAEVIDFKRLAGSARFWINKKTKKEITLRTSSSSKNSVTFLGSGDFHHISSILIKEFTEPVTVINFDFHPDWCVFPPWLSCGSWVAETLKSANVAKVVLLGMGSREASSFSVQAGDYAELQNNRIEIYPWAQKPSTAFFRNIPKNKSMITEKRGIFTKIYWNELKDKNLTEFLHSIIMSFPTKRVYISIDKDCLEKQVSLTNWEDGGLSLENLLLMLKIIKQETDIVGVNVTGDYSKVFIRGIIKKVISHLDHPKNFSAKAVSEADITRINENTNMEIMKILA
ncbi:MAG: arginase family protein [Candidatus Omnitrophota bacterium]|nr:arginase family protein [Candidatus Omnitrophota bacterium]